MVVNQKCPRVKEQSVSSTKKLFHKSTSVCYYKDNYTYRRQRKNKSDSNLYENKNGNAVYFYDYELIGDDFFLDVAHLDLKNRVEYTMPGRYGGDDRRVLLWRIEEAIAEKSEPRAMDKQHESNIFCLGFNSNNTKIFSGGNYDTVIVHDVITRRLPPILYNSCSPIPVCQFHHSDYYNSCTMKSCCFAGENDDYVLSGSDDFNLYVWRVSHSDCNKSNQWIDTHHMVLHGHRSIINQVRYNAQKCIIASSGVENIVKLWRPFETADWKGSLLEEMNGCDNPRDVFSHDEYVSLVDASGHNMAHDYTHQNTTEDPRMMAFFDSLVQRENESWNSSENTGSDKSSQHSSDGSSRPTATETSHSDSPNNFLTNGNGERCRRPRITMKPRTIYANRIAYLIATKRNTLKRLALKGAAQTERSVKSAKFGSPKMSARITRKSNGKRPGRLGMNCRKRSVDNHSDNDVPHKKIPSRRIVQHLNTSNYRIFRRKSKAPRFESPCTSSDDILSSSTENFKNLPSTSNSNRSTGKNNSTDVPNLSAHTTCVTVDVNNSSENDDDGDVPSPNIAIPVPSTSSGITSNGQDFRVTQSNVDSDDDPSPENSPRAIPVPINGTHHNLNPNNYSSGIEDERPNNNRYNNLRRRKASISLNRNQNNYGHYLFISCSEDDDASSNESLLPFFENKNKNFSENGSIDDSRVAAADENIFNNKTPTTSRAWTNTTPDSGIVISASSKSSGAPSTSRHDGNNNANGTRSGDTSVKWFQQKVARVRRNYRNNFGDDSDSD